MTWKQWKQFTYNGNYKWIDLLPRLVSEYNAQKHRTSVCNLSMLRDRDKFLTTVYNCVKLAASTRFKVGDLIRVSKFKTIFKKGYMSNWTTEVSRITNVQKTNLVTYLLEDYKKKLVTGGFYKYELHRVANLDVFCWKSVKQKEGWNLHKMVRIWQFAQFLDT